MDNRAQISIEYLVVVSLLITIAALVAILGTNMVGIKNGIEERAGSFLTELSEMIK